MPTTRTHHVALVHEGRIRLAPDGSLPQFLQDLDADDSPEPSAYASTLVGQGAHLAPVVRMPDADGRTGRDSDRLHVLALRGEPADGDGWRAVEELPEPWRARVRSAVQQYDDRAPALRPDWYLPGWHDRVESWVDASLAGAGRHRTGPLVTHRVWSISAVLRVPTDRGDLWFKACCDHFRAEAAILHRLSARLPDLVPVLVAVEDAEGWLLMEPLVGASDDDRTPGALAAVAQAWAAAQLSSLEWLDELADAGCPDRTLEPTLAAWRRVVATSPEMDLLTAEERAALQGSTAEVEARVREFWSCGIPDTLSHGDLHLGNVAYDGTTLRIFDWTDACLSHPFLDGSHLASFVDSAGSATEAMAGDLSSPWRAAYPDADVDRALELAGFADLVFQSVTFAAIEEATEDGAEDFTGTVAWLSRRILREIGAIPG